MPADAETSKQPRNGVERFVRNTWITLSERAAVYVLVAGLAFVGKMVADLRDHISHPTDGLISTVAEVRTIQDKAIVPALRAVEKDIAAVITNLLERPRFDKKDAERLDDKLTRENDLMDLEHNSRINSLDERLRMLEGRPRHAHPRGSDLPQ